MHYYLTTFRRYFYLTCGYIRSLIASFPSSKLILVTPTNHVVVKENELTFFSPPVVHFFRATYDQLSMFSMVYQSQMASNKKFLSIVKKEHSSVDVE